MLVAWLGSSPAVRRVGVCTYYLGGVWYVTVHVGRACVRECVTANTADGWLVR